MTLNCCSFALKQRSELTHRFELNQRFGTQPEVGMGCNLQLLLVAPQKCLPYHTRSLHACAGSLATATCVLSLQDHCLQSWGGDGEGGRGAACAASLPPSNKMHTLTLPMQAHCPQITGHCHMPGICLCKGDSHFNCSYIGSVPTSNRTLSAD